MFISVWSSVCMICLTTIYTLTEDTNIVRICRKAIVSEMLKGMGAIKGMGAPEARYDCWGVSGG